MIGKAFVDCSEKELVAAIWANWIEVSRLFGRSSRAEFDERPDLARLSCAIPQALLNGIFRTRLAPGRVDAAIEETVAHFGSRGVPAFSWWLVPDVQPADLGRHLQAHGFASQTGPSGMAVDLSRVDQEPASPAGLSIQVIGDERAFRQWRAVAATCFGLREYEEQFFDLWMELGFDLPLRHYLGLLRGEPVATSTLFLAAGVAGVYVVAVLPDVRNQGIRTAITLAPLLDVRAQGYHVGILQASPMGYNLYRRIGFREYCKMGHYVWERENGAQRNRLLRPLRSAILPCRRPWIGTPQGGWRTAGCGMVSGAKSKGLARYTV
jgi:GNAT superfamily N-acetyltransferase